VALFLIEPAETVDSVDFHLNDPSSLHSAGMEGELQCVAVRVPMAAPGLVSRVTPVQTALRNYTGDEGGFSGSAIRSLIPSRHKLLRSKAVVVSVVEKLGQ
jgi:hypothetical protein